MCVCVCVCVWVGVGLGTHGRQICPLAERWPLIREGEPPPLEPAGPLTPGE